MQNIDQQIENAQRGLKFPMFMNFLFALFVMLIERTVRLFLDVANMPDRASLFFYVLFPNAYMHVFMDRGKTANDSVYRTTNFSLKAMERRIKIYILRHFDAKT